MPGIFLNFTGILFKSVEGKGEDMNGILFLPTTRLPKEQLKAEKAEENIRFFFEKWLSLYFFLKHRTKAVCLLSITAQR